MSYTYDDELQHYGVKGMKWGVRKDVELLANRRRNEAVRKARFMHEIGLTSKEEKKKAISKANEDKKNYLDKVKKDFEGAKTQSDRDKMIRNITNQAIKEVPNRTFKKGSSAVASIITAYNIGNVGVAAAAATIANPAVGLIMGASVAGYTVGQLGRKYVYDRISDKLV